VRSWGYRFILKNGYERGLFSIIDIIHFRENSNKGILPETSEKNGRKWICITVLKLQHHLYPHSVILLDIAQQVSNK